MKRIQRSTFQSSARKRRILRSGFWVSVSLAWAVLCLNSQHARSEAINFVDPLRRQAALELIPVYRELGQLQGRLRDPRLSETERSALTTRYNEALVRYADLDQTHWKLFEEKGGYAKDVARGELYASLGIPMGSLPPADPTDASGTDLSAVALSSNLDSTLERANKTGGAVRDFEAAHENLVLLGQQIEGLERGSPDRARLESQYRAGVDAFKTSRYALTSMGCGPDCIASLGGGDSYVEPRDSVDGFRSPAEVAAAEAAAAEAARVAADEDAFNNALSQTANPNSVDGEVIEDSPERMETLDFANNSLGKAGEQVVLTRNAGRCGSEDASAGCERVAHSLDTMATISNYSDYASYAAVAGTIAPHLIFAGDQKEDQEKMADIQNVAGYANLAAAVVDVGIGAKARFGDARTLSRVASTEQARCQAEDAAIESAREKYRVQYEAFVASKNPANKPDPAMIPARTRSCERFSARAVGSAADKIKEASNTHFVIGGLKALGGVASLYLAKEARKNAQNLAELEDAEETDTDTNTVTSLNTGILGPSGVSANSVGIVEPGASQTGDDNSDTDASQDIARSSSVPITGGSIAPRRADLNRIAKGRAGSGSSPSGGSPATGGLTGSGSNNLLAENTDEESVLEPDSAVGFNGGGGGYLNQGATPLGNGDGGFGQMLGSVMQNIVGGGKTTDASNGGSFGAGASRAPSSLGLGSRVANAATVDDGQTLFQQIRGAIERRTNSGDVGNEITDVNQI